MNRQLAIDLQKKLQIAVDQITREEYELVLLSSLFASDFGAKLVFRGGTALRLAYGSPRFSDDLDFSALKPISEKVFRKWCGEVSRANPNLEVLDSRQKFYTLFGIFKIIDQAVPRSFSIKIEISTRGNGWVKEKSFRLMNIGSQVTPITVTAQVATLEKIEKEKLSIKPPRTRDVFDLWFIGQRLGKNTPMDFRGFSKEDVRAELNKYLSEGDRRLIIPWLPKK